MDLKVRKAIKVRVNALGTRIIGIVGVPPPHFRISDYLNSHDEFILVKQDRGEESLIAKDAISYLEALKEGEDKGSRPARGQFHAVTVILKEHVGTLSGEIFVPEGLTLQGALNKARRFINVRNVSFVNSPETYEFLAVGKQEIITVQERSQPA